MKKLILLFLTLTLVSAFSGCGTVKNNASQNDADDVLADGFSFEITWGFDGCYNSKTGVLKNGYNDTLNTECVTNLKLTDDELREIYVLLEDVDFYELPEKISENEVMQDPSYNLKITVNRKNETKTVVIYSPMKPLDEWSAYKDFGKAYFKIVNEYIKSSDEYKNLPPNTNLYD